QASKMRYMFGGKAKIPMTVRTMHGAGVNAAAQHSGSYYGIFASIPGVKVVVPPTPYDAKGLMLPTIDADNLVIFSEDKPLYGSKGDVPDDYYTIPIGEADVKREGEHLTIVTIGKMLFVGQEVAETLEKENVSVEVIDLRTISPWDHVSVIQSLNKTGILIVID